MLVSSLPPLPPQLDGAPLPISLERLRGRLGMLEPEDQQEMQRMFEILRWSRQFEESHDAAVVKRFSELMDEVSTPLIREVLTTLMDVRMITTALRRRRRGLGPPPLGLGRWFEQIRRHFNEPDFGLGRVFPRLSEFAPLLEQGDVLNVDQGLTRQAWAYFKRQADDYYFSFEAVVLYVARWTLIAQAQQLQAQRGRQIFEELVTEALGKYANVYV